MVLVRYIYSNHLQSLSLELDAEGEIISYEEYHPYGTTAYQAANAAIRATAKRYRYTGKERDDESGLYYHGARYYIPWLCRWTAVDPINSENYNLDKGYGLEKNDERQFTELTASPYEYSYDNPVMYSDPSGEQPPIINFRGIDIGFNIGFRVSLASDKLSFKLNASVGVGTKSPTLEGVGFAGVSVYAGNQLGTSSMTKGLQFDATAGAYATLGGGTGNSHVVNTLNPDTPSGITNDFFTSITYGQMFTYSSAINAERGPNDGGAIQKLAMVGFKTFGDLSFITLNDTVILGGGNTDKGQTGNGTVNVGGSQGFSLSYINYTGSYDIADEEKVKYGNFYPQSPYQQSLNESAFRIDARGTYLTGGTSNGSIQNAIHSVTGTGQFVYPNTKTDSSDMFNLFYNIPNE